MEIWEEFIIETLENAEEDEKVFFHREIISDLVKKLIAQKAEIERLNSQLSQTRTALRGVTKLAESRRI